MRILIFLTLFCFHPFMSCGQNVLELKNSKTGKTRILKQGSKLYFKSCHDSSFVKGKIVQIKDTSVVFYRPDYDEDLPLIDLKFEEISEFKKPTTLHAVSRSVGSVLLPIGTVLFFQGLIVLSRDNDFQGKSTVDEEQTKALAYTGGGLLLMGTLPFIIKPKVYQFKNGEWGLSVKRLNK